MTMAPPSNEPRPWAPRVFGVLSLLGACGGLLFGGCAMLAPTSTVSYGGLQVAYGPLQGGKEDAVVKIYGLRGVRPSRGRSQGSQEITVLRRSLGSLMPAKARGSLAAMRQQGRILTWGLLGLSLLLFGCALGQLGYRAWARPLSVAWGGLALVFTVFVLFYLLPELHIAAREVALTLLRTYRRVEAICPALGVGQRLLFGALVGTFPLATVVYFNGLSARRAMVE